MRICDRCHAKAVEAVTMHQTHESFDLCESCRVLAREFLTSNPTGEKDAKNDAKKRPGKKS